MYPLRWCGITLDMIIGAQSFEKEEQVAGNMNNGMQYQALIKHY